MVAIVLEVAFAVLAIGLRSWVHYRQTGDSPFRGGSGIGGGTAMFGLGALLLLGPVLDVTGALPRLVHGPWLTAVGVVVAGLGIVATVWAQFAMGASWRIGVDEKERTALVTAGPFRWVRNPIYTSMLLFSLGIALVVVNVAALLSFAIVVAMLEYHVRGVEEPYLEDTHGAEYRRYAAQAGRFLPRVGRLGVYSPS
jgi:protein-S-isoprenylcysteine O-methyltransferase Ste14